MSFAGYRGVAGGVPGGLTYGQASSSWRPNSVGWRGVDLRHPHAARRGELLDTSWLAGTAEVGRDAQASGGRGCIADESIFSTN